MGIRKRCKSLNIYYDLVKFYDNNLEILGKPFTKFFGEKSSTYYLTPISHIPAKISYVISIDLNGQLLGIQERNKESLIPTTMVSKTRSNQVAPHVLVDKLKYLTREDTEGFLQANREKYKAYIANLERLSDFEGYPRIEAILTYLKTNEIQKDIISAFPKLTTDKIVNCNIEFEVDGLEMCSDESFLKYWSQKFESELTTLEEGFDYITGETARLAENLDKYLKAYLFSPAKKVSFLTAPLLDKGFQVGYVEYAKAISALNFLDAHMGIATNLSEKQRMILVPIQDKIEKDTVTTNNFIFDLYTNILNSYAQPENKSYDLYRQSIGENTQNIINGKYNVLIVDLHPKAKASFIDYYALTQESVRNSYLWQQEVGLNIKRILSIIDPINKGAKVPLHIKTDLVRAVKEGTPLTKNTIRQLESVVLNYVGTKAEEISGLSKERVYERNINVFSKLLNYNNMRSGIVEDTLNKDRSYIFGRAYAVLHQMEVSKKREKDTKNNSSFSDTNALRNLRAMAQNPSVTYSRVYTKVMTSCRQSNYFDYYLKMLAEITSSIEANDFSSNQKLTPNFLLGFNTQLKTLNPGKEEK